MRPPLRSTPAGCPRWCRPAPALAGLISFTEEVVAFAREALATDPALRSTDVGEAIRDRFGVVVHPRSVERALARARNPKSDSR